MGGSQREVPESFKVSVWPFMMVRSSTSTSTTDSLSEDATQPHSRPAVNAGQRSWTAIGKVIIPAARDGRYLLNDRAHAASVTPFHERPDLFAKVLHTFR